MTRDAPTTAVIVCSRNRPVLLVEAVESVLGGETVPDEIVIVDQSDAPNASLSSRPPASGCAVQYLWDRERGVSRARNRGLAAAGTDLVVFTDDDVLVDRRWLAAMRDALVALGPGGVVTGRVLATAGETAGGWAPALVADEAPAEYQGRISRDVLEAGNMGAWRGALLELGGFDPTLGPGTPFPAGEDNDMGLRILAAGRRIRYEPQAVIYHRAWRGPEEYIPLRWRYGIGQGAYYAKHTRLRDGHMRGRLARLLGKHLGLAIRRAPREPRAAAGHLAYVAGVLAGFLRRAMGSSGARAGSLR